MLYFDGFNNVMSIDVVKGYSFPVFTNFLRTCLKNIIPINECKAARVHSACYAWKHFLKGD